LAEEVITDEMKAAIGMQSEPTVIEVEKGMITKFAEAIEDPNPLWQDEEYAKQARYGEIVAPPGFLMTVMMRGEAVEFPFQLPMVRILDGGGEWEYFKPIRPGDVLTVVNRLADIRERAGRTGKMVFLVSESTWRNQRNEIVAKGRGTLVFY
jgi:acyl dehydratase